MKPALFLHIQKTAGTSVQEMAREAYGNDQVISHGDFLKLGVEGCRPYNFVSGHFGYAFAQPLMEGRYCFTFLRDPIERLISFYEFCRTRDAAQNRTYQIAQTFDFEGFLSIDNDESHLQRIWNNQVWQLARGWGTSASENLSCNPWEMDQVALLDQAKTHVDEFDYIGFVSSFNEDISDIFGALGSPSTAPRWSNSMARTLDTSGLSRTARNRAQAMTELDRELYDYAVRKYFQPRYRQRRFESLAASLSLRFRRGKDRKGTLES